MSAHNSASGNLREYAELVAIQSLSFIAEDPERLGRFLAETGIGPSSLRAAAQDSTFLASILAYVLAHEDLLIAFAERSGLDPATVVRAQVALDANPPEV